MESVEPAAAKPASVMPHVRRHGARVALTLGLVLAATAIVPDFSAVATALIVTWAWVLALRRMTRTASGGKSSARRIAPFAPFALLTFVAVGLNALRAELSILLMIAVLLVATGLAIARWRLHRPRLSGIVVAVGSVLVPVVALLGFDALWATTGWRIRSPLVSFVLGAVLIAVATWLYLRPWWVREPHRFPRRVTVVVVALLIVAQPLGAAAVAWFSDDGAPADAPAAVVSELELIVLREASDPTRLPAQTTTRGWRVTTQVGEVTGDRIRWEGGKKPPRTERAGAERVLLLAVDGAPARLDRAGSLPQEPAEPGEIRRWLRLADEVTERTTVTLAVLKSTDPARRAAWQAALPAPTDGHDRGRHGGALSLQDAAGDYSLTDLALSAAAAGPDSDQHLALAVKHRPALFFHSSEPYPTPLNVETLLASKKIRFCEKGQTFGPACPTVHDSGDLRNNGGHLLFEPSELAEIDDDSTIYVHVSTSAREKPKAIFLDYWWYFPNNPTGAAHGALCGIGFNLAGATCFDHQSDWEGVTVVLDARADPPRPAAVLYAQHDGTTRYPWATLKRLWRDGGDERRVRARLHQRIDTDARALVFVAKGTHASYPTSCPKKACPVAGVLLNEKPHDGGRPWPHNLDESCVATCVAALPTRRSGNGRALWNSFDGSWGTASCVLAVICLSGDPPLSPGAQPRYRHPWCPKTTITTVNGRDAHRTRAKREPCPPRDVAP